MENNQVENQVDFQDDLILDDNFAENEENIVCNIYKEQFDLINELPEQERLKVLYIAVSKAFHNEDKKNKKNQLENQVENTYISSSISIYNSLSNYSKTLIKLLFKTINCKNYKNWGGKRKGSGRKKEPVTVNDDIKCYGEHLNVTLVKGDYEKLLAITQSKELLNEVINDLGTAIREGKEKPYNADLPYAHYERIRKYINYRKTHTNNVTQIGYKSATQRKADKLKELFGRK